MRAHLPSRHPARTSRLVRLGALALLLGALALLFFPFGASQSQAQFQVGFQDDGFESGGSAAQSTAAYGAMSTVDGSYVRIGLEWSSVAPHGARRPGHFHPADPADPHYQWGDIDAAIRSAAAHNLQVILVIARAPAWAEGSVPRKPYVSEGAWNPRLLEYERFIHAAAERYSGSFPDPSHPGANLPRVKYWEPWNEPNIPGFFSAPHPESAYRTLLGQAYGALKAVRPDNVVGLGGLAPVSPVPGSIPPLHFLADLLCLRPTGATYARNRSCQMAKFDVVTVHPYSLAATPTKRAYTPGDLLVGDLGELGTLVHAADRVYRTHYPIWVTEFSWYTNPPNTAVGDRPSTAARYVAYSLYEMWKSGVSLVIWFTVLDVRYTDPLGVGYGGGLYGTNRRPKLTLQALAFPFVAGVSHGRGFAWGRIPVAQPQPVVVERKVGHNWQVVARLTSTSDGTFLARFRATGNGTYRARVAGGPTSLAYDSRPIPPRRTHLLKLV